MRILVVEDDPALLRILNEGFREHRIEVVSAKTFHEGREKAALGSYAVIILDVGLPGGSGFDLCKRIRANGVSTPVMMLTARDAVDDRVFGLESGADDYLVKPFAFEELLARIGALLRRARPSELRGPGAGPAHARGLAWRRAD
jgi:two-component system copper resistance phosphate regulon response regulator CusR